MKREDRNTVSTQSKRWASYAWEAACQLFALMPFAMVIANRSSPLIVSLSALCALLATGLEGNWRIFAKECRRFLSTPIGVSCSAFLLWGFLSASWSDSASLSLRMWGEFVLVIVAVTGLAIALPKRLQVRHAVTLWVASVVGCFLILLDFATGFALRQWLNRRAMSYIFNRPVLTLLLLILPFLGGWRNFVASMGKAQGRLRVLLAASLLLFVVVLVVADSGAAVLGAVIACISYAAVRLLPRLSMGLAIVGLSLSLLAAPFTGPIMDRFFPAAALDVLQAAHARDRVEIWRVFGDVSLQRPVLGAGFGSSPVAASSREAQKLSLDQAQLAALNMAHPHNWALQVWYELGAVGACLALAIALLTLKAIWRMPTPERWGQFAFFATVVVVSLTAHGAWQGWWTAAIGGSIVWFRALERSTAPQRE